MLAPVVGEMAALAQSREIAGMVVAGIVIEVGAGETYPGDRQGCLAGDLDEAHLVEQRRRWWGREARQTPPATVAPHSAVGIEPAPVAQVNDVAAMRSAAVLAPSLGAPEPDCRRQLAPIDRVEPAHGGADRHDGIVAEAIASDAR